MANFRAVKPIILLTATALALVPLTANAQIYADFTVSQGTTPLGTFRARLDHDKVPRTCANFVGLATGRRPWVDVSSGALKVDQPYYNGLTFHRLIHNFMIQGGSPNGLGTDGPGFAIQDEFDGNLRHSGRYMLSMAKSSLPNTGGSQFFITLEAASHLDDKHSVFGEVISGRSIIDGFANPTGFPTDRSVAGALPGNPNYSDRPVTPIIINSVVISGPDLNGFDIDSPALMLPRIGGVRVTPSRNSAAGSFTMSFDRLAQHEYFDSYSLDLAAWTPFRRILSSNSEVQYPFTITGVTFPRFFSRIVDVDYSLLPNPPANLMPAGASLSINDRTGNTLTLVSNGSGGGTWSDSSGASGTLTSLVTYDGSGTSGASVSTTSNAHLIPLAQVMATLNTPAGINNRSSFNLVLSFHTANSGWADGTASGGANPLSSSILQHFTYTP